MKIFKYNKKLIKQICLNIKNDNFTKFILINEKLNKDKLLRKQMIKFKSYNDLCQNVDDIKVSLVASNFLINEVDFSKNGIFGSGIIKNVMDEN